MEEEVDGVLVVDDEFERVVFVVEVSVEVLVDDVLAMELRFVNVDERIKELLLEVEMTVWSVVAETVEVDWRRITRCTAVVCELIQCYSVRATTYLQAVSAASHIASTICGGRAGIRKMVATIA